MALSPDDAADRLRDIAAIERHSQRVYAYQAASPQLILWGVLWVVGYGLGSAWPAQGRAIWSMLVAIGLAAGFLAGLGSARRRDARTAAGVGAGLAASADPLRGRAVARLRLRFFGIAAIGFAFIAASLAVMAPVGGRQVDAFIPLVVAAGYALLGLWRGVRFVAVGVALATLTLAGFFLLGPYFGLWMALFGGGALMLGGLWLRRV